MSRHEHTSDAHHHDPTANTIFGFWIYLMTDCIMFATLFAAYAVLHDSTFGGPTARELFSLPYALAGTVVLLLSSFTCGMAMLAVPRKEKMKTIAWYGVTFVLGLCFLALIGVEFSRLVESGNGWQRNAFLTSYFTLIGTHALHIVFGLVFMALFMVQVFRWGLIEITIRRLSCLKIFWFFSYLIWIFMFAIVYLIGAN